jgi:chaperone required for assembly of F1-ATPase
MPNAATLSSAVETAAKCAPTASRPSARSIQVRAVAALVIVSTVVKVFEATMISVVAGSSPFSVSAIWAPSTLETKWQRGPS